MASTYLFLQTSDFPGAVPPVKSCEFRTAHVPLALEADRSGFKAGPHPTCPSLRPFSAS